MRKTFHSDSDRAEILHRLGTLTASAPRRWGTMTAPRMVAHLRDQMSHCLGIKPCAPVRMPLRGSWFRYLSIYVAPWPRGWISGPPDAFVTVPAQWADDIADLRSLVNSFAATDPEGSWPDHALFGPMRGRDWGFFCYRHCDHHLRQFGA